jgi:hypothetical protein
MVLNATFYNISAMSWQSVLLVKETGVPGENYRLVLADIYNFLPGKMSTTVNVIMHKVPSCGSWIYNYLCNQCKSPQKLCVWTPFTCELYSIQKL